jgi:hypothetical protein
MPSSWAVRASKLEKMVAGLARRVARLEKAAAPARPAPASEAPTAIALVDRLRRLKGDAYEAPGVRGAVAYAGAARFGEREHLWVREHGLPAVLGLEPARLARALATLGHPARLALVHALLRGPAGSQELQEVLGVSSAGPLYHHLKDLIAAGIVVQARRNVYEIPAHHVVPLLTVLAAAHDCLAGDPGAPS